MKWFDPKDGDRRIKCRFLFFPMKINAENCWLEKAKWEEKFVKKNSCHYGYWHKLKWVS